jgi:hypothetical protein
MRTLLAGLALAAIAAGGIRYWYDLRTAAHRRDRQLVELPHFAGTTWRWSDIGRFSPEAFRRVEHLWCEDADLTEVAPRLRVLDQLKSLQVLARQIVPHATVVGAADPVAAALRRHPTLRQIVVDASIRGAPLEFDAPVYTRADLTRLEAALPNIEIVWIEVN